MDPSIKIPEGMAVAGMGRRIAAWLLDAFFSAIVAGVVIAVGIIASGAVSVNRQAIDQYDEYALDPFAGVTAPLLDVNTTALAVVVVAYVVAMALYLVWPWIAWGASPAQKMLGLRVVDVSTGRNLGIDQALLRWVILTGVTTVISAVGIVTALDWIANTPTNEWMQTGRYGGTTTQADFGFGGLNALVSYGSSLWPIILVIVTGIDKMKRGWHDKAAGSIVLGPIKYSAYAAYPGYGAAPVWPPQAPGAAPTWPPQPAGTPPQAPGYPPSAYPGYQGYPGYPGYPPQAQPPAAPFAPPAAPEPPAEPAADKPKRTPRKKPQE